MRKTGLALGIFAAAFGASAASAVTVYSNDFQSGSTANFSGGSIVTSPNGTAKFLGALASGGATTLTLTGLAAHSTVTLNFDLDVILSMDGDGQFGGGRDQFLLTSAGTMIRTLLDNDYAIFPGNTQDNGGQGTPTIAGGYAAGTGALSKNTFGYAYNGDTNIGNAVYRYSFTFADAAPTISFTFRGNTSEGVDNEFYGIDNVSVATDAVAGAVPEPATWGMMLTGFGLIGFVARRAKRLAPATA